MKKRNVQDISENNIGNDQYTKKKKKESTDASNTTGRTKATATTTIASKGQQPQRQPQQRASKNMIKITQQDHDRIVQLLRTIDWTMAKNTSRKNVIREHDPNTHHNNKGKAYCQSFIFGRNMKDPHYEYSFWSKTYPIIYQELQQFIAKYLTSTSTSDFTYTHITLNKNLQCKRHTDGGNAGLSYIIALGDYTGGQLQIDDVTVPTTTTNNNNNKHHTTSSTIYDLYRTFVLFNGKEQPHETLPFTGERYTLVYYTSDIVPTNEGTAINIWNDDNHAVATTSPSPFATTTSTTTTNRQNADARPLLPGLVTQDGSTGTISSTNNNATVSRNNLTEKFLAMKKKLGRKR